MTGIERLRDFLADIADQIERESDVETVRSEAMRAWEWVREHGGLDHVKAEWCSRVPHDKHEQRRRRLLNHIAGCEAALGRRNVRIEELGHRVSDLTTENAELRKRAMPEGCQWPRYEDGETVRIWDKVEDIEVRSIVFNDCGVLLSDCTSVPGWGTWRSYKERVKRPAPAVLAADGEPLEVGQTVYTLKDDRPYTVKSIEGDHVYINAGGAALDVWYFPGLLTHQRPVLGADGVPIETCQKMRRVRNGEEVRVSQIDRGEHPIITYIGEDGLTHEITPDGLTHTKPEPPDSRRAVVNEIGDEMAARIDLLVSSGRWSDAD